MKFAANANRPDASAADAKLLSELGRVIARVRTAHGRTLAYLSEEAGVALADLERIEAGQLDPTISQLIRLTGALQVSVGEVLDQSSNGLTA